ncbi:MAG: hypothetical protein ACJATT_004226 [Myxococcota bacterium]|jgi:hypothetical protein
MGRAGRTRHRIFPKLRITTSDPDRCHVTPTSVPSIPRRQLIKWGEVTDERDIFCDSTFTARTMPTTGLA